MRFLPIFLLLTLPALADENVPGASDTTIPLAPPATEPSSTLAPRSMRHGGKVGREQGSGKKKSTSNTAIRGHCTLLESPLNPITGPCISVPIELKDGNGRSMGIARTSAQGDFEFTVEDNGPFTLAPSSGYYVLVSPNDRVRRGDRVDLRIREKN